MLRYALPAFILLIGGCEATTQTTSGADYLARSTSIASAAKPAKTAPANSRPAKQMAVPTLQDDLIAAASVEPALTFPARIGLARIVSGRLTVIPDREASLWRGAVARHHGFGTFVPVDPMIAEFTSAEIRRTHQCPDCRWQNYGHDTVSKIRLGAARQHLDAVLIYEVEAATSTRSTRLAFADLTLIGGALLPTRKIEAEGRAAALLIDVLNGYPYGTATTSKDVSELATSWGNRQRREDLAERASASVVASLVPEVERIFTQLRDRQAARTKK